MLNGALLCLSKNALSLHPRLSTTPLDVPSSLTRGLSLFLRGAICGLSVDGFLGERDLGESAFHHALELVGVEVAVLVAVVDGEAPGKSGEDKRS